MRNTIGLLSCTALLLSATAYGNGITWRDWSEGVFRDAQQQDKLVLLNLTAQWGRWCTLMQDETYSDPAVVDIVSASYIPVRVDRDNHPEISDRYKAKGWPTVAILTGTGEVIEKSTYMEPERLVRLLELVDKTYRAQRDDIDNLLARTAQQRQRLAEMVLVHEPTFELTLQIPPNVKGSITLAHDDVYGGFPGSHGNKYPHAAMLRYMLYLAAVDQDKEAARVARTTLDNMAIGGLRDHIDGGFYRYVADPRWRRPQFEKRLQDNVELLEVYVRGLAVLKEPYYAVVAEETIRFLDTVLYDSERGLYRLQQESLARGTEDDPYHTWTVAELQDILSSEDYETFALRYGITELGDLVSEDGISRNGLNVLYLAQSKESVQQIRGISEQDVLAQLGVAVGMLQRAHANMPQPPVDNRCPVTGNAILVRAYLAAAVQLNQPRLRERALAVLDTLATRAYDTSRGAAYRVSADGAEHFGLAEDDVELALALLAGYQHTGKASYLQQAEAALAVLDRRFGTPSGVYVDIAKEETVMGLLSVPLPSSFVTFQAAHALLDLSALTGEKDYRKRAYKALRCHVPIYAEQGAFAAPFGREVYRYFHPHVRAVITGERESGEAQALHTTALATQLQQPNIEVQQLDPAADKTHLRRLGLDDKGQACGYACPADGCGTCNRETGAFRNALLNAAVMAQEN